MAPQPPARESSHQGQAVGRVVLFLGGWGGRGMLSEFLSHILH